VRELRPYGRRARFARESARFLTTLVTPRMADAIVEAARTGQIGDGKV
jgi:hypothetical protein